MKPGIWVGSQTKGLEDTDSRTRASSWDYGRSPLRRTRTPGLQGPLARLAVC